MGELRAALLPRSALDTCKLSRKEVEALAQPIRHFGPENVRAALGCATSIATFGGEEGAGKERQSVFFDLLRQQKQSAESDRCVDSLHKALKKSHEPQHIHARGWEARKHKRGDRLTVGDEVCLRKGDTRQVGIIVKDDYTARPYLVVGNRIQSDEWRSPGDVSFALPPEAGTSRDRWAAKQQARRQNKC